jgi:hypothetical protein
MQFKLGKLGRFISLGCFRFETVYRLERFISRYQIPGTGTLADATNCGSTLVASLFVVGVKITCTVPGIIPGMYKFL